MAGRRYGGGALASAADVALQLNLRRQEHDQRLREQAVELHAKFAMEQQLEEQKFRHQALLRGYEVNSLTGRITKPTLPLGPQNPKTPKEHLAPLLTQSEMDALNLPLQPGSPFPTMDAAIRAGKTESPAASPGTILQRVRRYGREKETGRRVAELETGEIVYADQ